MARFDSKKLTREKQEEIWDEFCQVLANLDTLDDIKRFFRDLLNRSERTMLVRRLQIAKLLEEGFTYREIRNLLHVGVATISRVERWLNFGRGGYKRAIKKLKKLEGDVLKKKKETLSAYERLKKKYAMYYWPEFAAKSLQKKISQHFHKRKRRNSIKKTLFP